MLDGNRQNALAAIGLELALVPNCGEAAAAAGIAAGSPTPSAAATATSTATAVSGPYAGGPHPQQQQAAVPAPPSGTSTTDILTGPAVTPGGEASGEGGPASACGAAWSTPRSCSSLWRHNTHARFYQCRLLAMELRTPDVDPRTGLIGAAAHPPGQQRAGEEEEEGGSRGGNGKERGGAAAGEERAGAGKAERLADVPLHGALRYGRKARGSAVRRMVLTVRCYRRALLASYLRGCTKLLLGSWFKGLSFCGCKPSLRVYFDTRGEADLRDARSSGLAVVQIAGQRDNDEQQKGRGSSSTFLSTSAGEHDNNDDGAAGRSGSLLSRGMRGLSRMVEAAGKKVAAGLTSGSGVLAQQGQGPSSSAPGQQGDKQGRSAGPPGWDVGQLAAEGLWEGEAVWDRDGWPAAPATVAVGLQGGAWEPSSLPRRPVLQRVAASARPTASWMGEVAPGHAKVGCERSGSGEVVFTLRGRRREHFETEHSGCRDGCVWTQSRPTSARAS